MLLARVARIVWSDPLMTNQADWKRVDGLQREAVSQADGAVSAGEAARRLRRRYPGALRYRIS